MKIIESQSISVDSNDAHITLTSNEEGLAINISEKSSGRGQPRSAMIIITPDDIAAFLSALISITNRVGVTVAEAARQEAEHWDNMRQAYDALSPDERAEVNAERDQWCDPALGVGGD